MKPSVGIGLCALAALLQGGTVMAQGYGQYGATTKAASKSTSVTTVAPIAPSAEQLRFAVALGIQNQWYLDESARIFSDKRLSTGGGLSVVYRLFEIRPSLFLSGGIDWQAAATSGIWALGAAGSNSHTLLASGLLRYAPYRWLRPFARLSVGARHDAYVLHAQGAPSIRSGGWVPAGMAGLGIGALSSSHWLVKLGFGVAASFDLEAGFVLAGTQKVVGRATGGGEDAISVAGPRIAEIEGAQPYFRISLGLHF